MSNNKTIILTDSSCDMNIDYVKENNIYVFPLTFDIEDKNYEDDLGQTLSYKEFYNKLREGYTSTTSQVNTYTFESVFKKLAGEGYSMIYLGLSSGLSQTVNNAIMVKREILEENPSIDLTVIDTKCASVGLGALVYYASEMLKSGKSKDEIVYWINENMLKVQHLFTVDSLEHLRRGGRVSATAATVGILLDIKPFLIVDDEGKLEVLRKIRGRKKSIKSLLDVFRDKAVNPEEQVIFINHGDCIEDAEYLRNMILEEFKVKDVILSYVGPTMGSHTGPGMLCLIFLGDNRNVY